MKKVNHIKKTIKEKLKPKRYQHSIAVLETALELAREHGVSEKDTVWASLLHDYAKNLSDKEMRQSMKRFGIEMDPVIKARINLAHGLVGAELVKEEFDIKDENILNAIRYHTFGRAHMSELEKIIYLADFIEPGRQFHGVHKLREWAYKDIDKTMLMALEHTIKYVMGSKRLLHPNTVYARNYFVGLEGKNGTD